MMGSRRYLSYLLSFLLMLSVAFGFLIGCGTNTELATAQTNLATAQTNLATASSERQQAQIELATAEAQIAVQATQIVTANTALATAEALVEAGRRQNDDLRNTLDATNKQLSETKIELEEVKFAVDNLLNEAEAALRKQDLQEAQRVARLLDERYPGSPQGVRATEIVTLIEKATAEKVAAERERIAAATKKMRSETDSVRGITFYEDKTTTQHTNVNSFHLYIGKNETRIWMRLRIQYTDDDWLFIRKFVIKADDQQFSLSTTYSDIKRDNSSGSIWEWYDGQVQLDDIAMIKAVIAAQSVTLRYDGEQYYFDRQITAAEKQALQNVLDAFVALGGDLSRPQG